MVQVAVVHVELVAVGLQHLLVRLLVRPDELAGARKHERAARIVGGLRRGLRGARALRRGLDDLLREVALRRTHLRHERLQLLGAARERVRRREHQRGAGERRAEPAPRRTKGHCERMLLHIAVFSWVAGAASADSFRVARRHKNFAVAARRHRRHGPDCSICSSSRAAVVADPQMALHERDRCAAVLDDDLDRWSYSGSDSSPPSPVPAPAGLVAVGGAAFEQALDVVRLALLLELLDDAVHFVIRDERAMHAHRQPVPGAGTACRPSRAAIRRPSGRESCASRSSTTPGTRSASARWP